MTLSVGTRLGTYEVLSALGAGGMGEVYRARDTRLNRSVAIKVLPEAFITDSDRLARFKREAQVLASLNHPNIAAIYHVEESDGVSALVMELVEGETLADRIAHGPIPVDEALPIARQIAEALEAAHEQGVIHRDLKPANIKRRPDGAVKVLDFGLAKAFEPTTPIAADMTASPTIASPAHAREGFRGHATQVGVILGTAAYMSPEQARGKAVDKRADIWAFGCVLFEMLVGAPPFTGETLTDMVAAVLKNEPDWKHLPAHTPSAIRRLLRRCLAKAPEQRLRDIGDARFEINEVIRGATQEESLDDPTFLARNRWRERAAWFVAAAAVLTAVGFALRRAPVPASADVIRFSVPPPENTSFTGAIVLTVGVPQFELSPDGRTIVFVAAAAGARPTLWLRSFDSVEAHSLPGTEGAEYPFWSPDNGSIGYFADGELRRISRQGGPSTRLASAGDSRPASWARDDTILFSKGNTGILRVSARGGSVTPVTELDASRQEGSHRSPQLLPDGVHFIYQVRSSTVEQGGIYTGSLDGTMKKLLISGKNIASGQPVARYAAGHLFFLDGETLMGQVFDTDRLELRGQAFVVQGGVGRSSGSSGAFSLSASGDLAYAGTLLAPSRLRWFDRFGEQLSSTGLPKDYTDFRLSPDDGRLAASVADPRSGFPDIWLTDLTQGPQRTAQITLGPAVNASPVWTSDSSRIIFRTTRTGGLSELYSKSAGGGGNEEPELASAALRRLGMQSVLVPTDLSRDGMLMFWATIGSDSDNDLWFLRLSDKLKPTKFLSVRGDQWHANFSPTGDLVAYTSTEFGRFEVRAQTVPVSDRQWTISADAGGYEPRWRADGREIYYLSGGTLMAVTVEPGPKFGPPKALFPVNVSGGVSGLRTHYVASRDGQRFLISTPEANQTQTSITIVLNATAGFTK